MAALLAAAVVAGPVQAADVAAGKAKATEVCAACHGENGISTTENIPSLAGQQDQFIQWQLVFFRAGTRKNEQMQPVSNSSITRISATSAPTSHP